MSIFKIGDIVQVTTDRSIISSASAEKLMGQIGKVTKTYCKGNGFVNLDIEKFESGVYDKELELIDKDWDI